MLTELPQLLSLHLAEDEWDDVVPVTSGKKPIDPGL
jgi:hypothetical protein